MQSIFNKYPKWTHSDPDIKPLIDEEVRIYKQYIQDFSVSSGKAESALGGLKRITLDIKAIIRKKYKDES
jgi:hypothetical protein